MTEMNNKLLIAVAVLILLGLGVFLFMNSKKSAVQTEKPTGASEKTASSTTSLKEMLTAGTSQKCTFNDTSDGANVNGTSYVSGGKVRADFTSVSGGTETVGHMIYDGKTSYIWTDGQETGFMMEVDPSKMEAGSETTQNQGIDINKEVDYDCNSWSADNAMFTPPTEVSFQSFAIPTGAMETSPQGNQNLCASCDSMTGEQKTQCLTALNCN